MATYDWNERHILTFDKNIALSTNDLRVFYNGTKEAIHGVLSLIHISEPRDT